MAQRPQQGPEPVPFRCVPHRAYLSPMKPYILFNLHHRHFCRMDGALERTMHRLDLSPFRVTRCNVWSSPTAPPSFKQALWLLETAHGLSPLSAKVRLHGACRRCPPTTNPVSPPLTLQLYSLRHPASPVPRMSPPEAPSPTIPCLCPFPARPPSCSLRKTRGRCGSPRLLTTPPPSRRRVRSAPHGGGHSQTC